MPSCGFVPRRLNSFARPEFSDYLTRHSLNPFHRLVCEYSEFANFYTLLRPIIGWSPTLWIIGAFFLSLFPFFPFSPTCPIHFLIYFFYHRSTDCSHEFSRSELVQPNRAAVDGVAIPSSCSRRAPGGPVRVVKTISPSRILP